MTEQKRIPRADFNPKSRAAAPAGAVPGLNLDAFEQLATRKRDAAACDARLQQKPGSVAAGFDPKPALPPHRRPK
jgi:hypothetical protein